MGNSFRYLHLYNKRRYVCLFVCLSVSMFRMAGQTAGPIETKLDTRTHVHPGSVSGKVNVKVIHVCVRDWQKYETPGTLRESDTRRTMLKLRPEDGGGDTCRLPNDYETPSGRRVIARVTTRGAAGASRTPSGGRVIRASNNNNKWWWWWRWVLFLGIRGEDAGTLVCYKKEEGTRDEDKAILELKVLGNYSTLRVSLLL